MSDEKCRSAAAGDSRGPSGMNARQKRREILGKLERRLLMNSANMLEVIRDGDTIRFYRVGDCVGKIELTHALAVNLAAWLTVLSGEAEVQAMIEQIKKS